MSLHEPLIQAQLDESGDTKVLLAVFSIVTGVAANCTDDTTTIVTNSFVSLKIELILSENTLEVMNNRVTPIKDFLFIMQF
ncbi:MAG: hypothetical protein NTX05_06660 [Fusobacteria bacterium]|nr:hypothetical protein [Fusobacteriota bacterium]